jgi:PERQ amino acid-rich with GYF domain-containing protein
MTSVNSPIKMVQPPKDSTGTAPIGPRKTSLSSYTTGGSASRPGTRRRDTSDSFTANGPLSPTGEKTFFRGESNTATPPPALLRRRTDFKDDDPSPGQKDPGAAKEEDEPQTGFGGLRRSATGPLSAGLNPPGNSPWASGGPASAFGSMGSFGSFNAAAGPPTQDKPEQRPGFGSGRGSSRFKDLLAKSSAEDMHAIGKDKAMFGALEKLPEEEGGESSASKMRDLFKTRPNRSETNPFEEAPARTGSAALSQEGSGAQPGIDQMGFSSVTGPGAFDPMSPAHTDPYQSPHGVQRQDGSHEGLDSNSQPLPPFRRNLLGDPDNAQRLPSGGFGSFGAFGGPPGPANWSAAPFGTGTPARERGMGFGDPIFSPLSDMQSPGAGLASGFFGGGAFGSMGRSNRLGGMLPQGMNEQMRVDSRNEGRPFDRPDSAAQTPRDPFDNGFSRGSAAFHDAPDLAGYGPQSSAPQQPGSTVTAGPTQPSPSGSDPGLNLGGQTPNDGMPAAQQRQMVMPDRMRWIYRDPSGNIQGPWSGLEMHDWFKAGFFTAELLVKKVEDGDFEPLAQLVRRIGNSREPFLVPQIGVPHGPGPGTAQPAWPNAPQPTGNAQPPFASAFPSFGTTLTAEQQNPLERRKQEEQYLMARQKEHLAQQQMMAKQVHIPGPGHGLHSLQHHASAHSLHSQPSYGSISSPSAGYHPSPLPPAGSQNIGHAPIGQAPFPRDEVLPNFGERLSLNQPLSMGAGPLGAPGEVVPSQQQVNSLMQERQRLAQQPIDTRAHQEAFLGQQGRNERLEEFEQLQGEIEDGRPGPEPMLAPIGAQRPAEERVPSPEAQSLPTAGQLLSKTGPAEKRSLTEQVQWTTAQQQHQADEPRQVPPVSISPLPAPAAQRNRQHVADSLVPETRSQTQTPIETPATSVAPWAERSIDSHKGPSLREIQEAEAKKAAQQAEIAEAARRAQAEQDLLRSATSPAAPAPGLPATATWGTSSSPGTPTAGPGSVWAKPTVKTGTTPTAAAKKTLAQIQKEEEARKQRAHANVVAAAQVQAQTAGSPVGGVPGKRYAELASKAAPATPVSNQASAWTTVGSGGKVKPPATVIATAQGTVRSVSSAASPGIASPLVKRPTLPARSSTIGEKNKAQEEFNKWLRATLGKGLNPNINGTYMFRTW